MDHIAHDQDRDRLRDLRTELYGCLTRWGDTLFELCDAALCAPGALHSVPSLSLEPTFRRSHGSLYKSLARGQIDDERLRLILVANRPKDCPDVFAVDASVWDRADAECSPERGFYYSASKHSAGQPIVAGWSYQWISQLSFTPDSWTAPLNALRISPRTDATGATIDQVRRLVEDLGPKKKAPPLFVFDAGYDGIAIGAGLADVRAQVLVRIKSDRVFYDDPGPRHRSTKGRPPRHGRRFKLSDARTAPRPDAEIHLEVRRYGTVRVRAWHHRHPKLIRRGRWAGAKTPIVRGSVIRVDVEHLPNPIGRTKKTLWLWWSGTGEPDLELCFRAYLRRFDIEHTYRFVKNTLGWTTPSLQTPEQADRWTWIVIAAYTQLRLARPLVDDLRLPWERRLDPARLTPARVRRGFSSTSCNARHSRQSTEIRYARPGPSKGHTNGPTQALPSHQEERLTQSSGFNRKLRVDTYVSERSDISFTVSPGEKL